MGKEYIKNQLLCTFSKLKFLEQNINYIKEQYTLVNNKIIVINNVEDENEMFCIYNIAINNGNVSCPNTILIHRKRQTNTLYTINSLNALIWLLNNGEFNHNFIVPWKNYRNSLLRIKDDKVDIVKTRLYKVYKFD